MLLDLDPTLGAPGGRGRPTLRIVKWIRFIVYTAMMCWLLVTVGMRVPALLRNGSDLTPEILIAGVIGVVAFLVLLAADRGTFAVWPWRRRYRRTPREQPPPGLEDD